MAEIDEILRLRNSDRLGDRLEALERDLRLWGKLTRTKMLFRLAQMGVREKSALYKSVKYKLLKRRGDLEGVAFSLARHGIFLERGVGRGRPKGSELAAKYAKPWIAPTLDPAIEELADLISENYADIAAGEIKITIPGIINTKISI